MVIASQGELQQAAAAAVTSAAATTAATAATTGKKNKIGEFNAKVVLLLENPSPCLDRTNQKILNKNVCSRSPTSRQIIFVTKKETFRSMFFSSLF